MGAFRPTVLRVGFLVGLLFGLLPLLGAQAASGGTWSTTGSMNQGRESFAAALLADGRVLVAGGFNGTQGALASAEIYDPGTGKWTTTGSMNEGREFFTATRLQDGKVLVAGGTTGPVDGLHDTDSAELYDPSTGKWTTTGSLSESRSDHTATLLPNGKVLVAGGTSGKSYLKSAELYDPSSGSWSSAGDMKSGRYSHTATLLQNGKVLVAAGSSASDGTPLSTADIYDPGSNSWTAAKPLNIARRGHAAALLQNGKVLVAGGITCPKCTPAYTATAELYDPSSDSWSYAGYMTIQRSAPTATLLQNGKVLVAGGVTGKAENTNSAELFDPATDTWTATGSMADKRFAHTATLLSDGRVLVAGGSNGYVNNVAQELTSAELYGSVISSALTVNAATGNYDGTTTLSATLTANGNPISGKTITFTLNGHDAGSATTDGSGVATLKDVSLSGLNVDSYPITASFAGDSDYGASSGSSTLTIDKAEPVITWDNPADITYGTPLGDTQLNATASVPGTFTYTPAAGTVLDAGANQTLKVDFTPTDTTNYASASKQVEITVLKADLTVTASDASKVVGAPNPALTGTITGIQNNDPISAAYSTTATDNSPAGSYPIVPTLDDPDGRLGNYNVTINNGTLNVTYAVCAQYNQTQGNQRGSTIPIKIQLCDVNGKNVSSSSVTVHAESIVRLPDGTPQAPVATGNSNPNNDFQYQSMLGMTSGYSYNLSTKGLESGTYNLQFSASGDPLPHTVLFTIR